MRAGTAQTIQYQDINYQLSQNEDKTAIFESWCDFLNYFDSSVQFQLSFVNLSASQETFARSITIPPCGDEFDAIRAEYAEMLQNQLARGNNGLIKTKYLTFGIEADNLRTAKPRLERIETDLLNNFKRLGVVAVRRLSASMPKVRYLVLIRPLLPRASWFCSISAYSARIASNSSPQGGMVTLRAKVSCDADRLTKESWNCTELSK